MNKTVLVTGGAGYVGSHACKLLAESGFVPVSFDNLSIGHRWAVKWGPLVVGEVADQAAVQAALEAHRPAAVMHFAGSALVEESVRDPLLYYRNNVVTSIALLAAMKACGVDKLVFSSSCTVYGIPDTVPITEAHPRVPVSPYGITKFTVERAIESFSSAYGMRGVSLRYFNAAGADAGGEIGEDHDPETHLIPRVLDAALGRIEAIDVFGEDYPTPDGTCIRDYVHVTDLADAHIRALRYLLDGGRTAFLNLGTGRGCSVSAVIDTVRKVTARPFAVRRAPRRLGDPPELVADAGAAYALLQWQPKHSTVERIVEDAWRWHKRHFGG